jgi:TolA-binding protein
VPADGLDQEIRRARLRIEQLLLHLTRVQAWQRRHEQHRLHAEAARLELLERQRQQAIEASGDVRPAAAAGGNERGSFRLPALIMGPKHAEGQINPTA